jgi:hypothetical protein
VIFELASQTHILRDATGLIAGCRVVAACEGVMMVDWWAWLNRETDDMEELRPYRIGMFGDTDA